MRVYLCDGHEKIVPNKYQTELMRRVALDVINILNDIYSKDDIQSIEFHLKGVQSIDSLLIRILLNFVESDDVIEVAKSRFSKFDRPGIQLPGLDYLSLYKNFMDEGRSEISFWYTFTPEETKEWNIDSPQMGFEL